MAAELWQGATAELGGNTMPGTGSGDGGINRRAGDDDGDVEELRRGVGGYERETGTVAGDAGGEGGTREAVSVQARVEVLEKKLKEMEEKMKTQDRWRQANSSL